MKGGTGTYKPKDHIIVTVPIRPELHRRMRVAAAMQGLTIKQFLTACIERAVGELN